MSSITSTKLQWANLVGIALVEMPLACLIAGGRKAGPRLAAIDPQSVKSAFRAAKAPAIPVRGSPEYDAAKKVLDRKRVVLVDADGALLGVAVVPASVQDRDCMQAPSASEQVWPSLREAVLDGAFAAERGREWSNQPVLHAPPCSAGLKH